MQKVGLLGRFLEWLAKTLLPYQEIRNGQSLYIRRHYLTPRSWKKRWFLHLICRPDEDRDPHDHPWDWEGMVLSLEGYIEEIFDGARSLGYRVRRPWQWGKRKAEFTHLIRHIFGGRVWTLICADQARRDWGFWTPDGWVREAEYKRRNGKVEGETWEEDRIPNQK